MANIYKEIKQEKPLTKEAEFFLTLLRTSDFLRDRTEKSLKQWGISPEQFNILRILRGTPQGLPTLEVGARMVSRGCNISRLVNKLVAKGYVKRERVKNDRRIIVLMITEKGMSVLKGAAPHIDSAVRNALDGITSKQIDSAVGILDRVRERIFVRK